MGLLKSGAILFAASMAGNLCNYFFQFFMGRHLSLADFGALNAALSITAVLGIPAGTVMLVVAKYSSTFSALGKAAELSRLYRSSLVFSAATGLLVFAAFLALERPLAAYLKLPDGYAIAIVGFGLLFSFAMTVNMGMLQGLKRFIAFGAALALAPLVKLVSGALLVSSGAGLDGAVLGTAVPAVVVLAATSPFLLQYLRGRGRAQRLTLDIAAYSVPVLLASVAFAAMANMDMIVVKHWAAEDEAGMYSAVAVLGKTILYLPSAIVLAIFPMTSESEALRTDTYGALGKGLACTAAFSAAGVAFFALFPGFTIGLLFGERFASAAPLLKYYGLAMMLMALLSVLVTFNLARRSTSFIYSLVAGSAALFALLHLVEGSLFSTVLVIIGVNLAVAAWNAYLAVRGWRADARATASGRLTEAGSPVPMD